VTAPGRTSPSDVAAWAAATIAVGLPLLGELDAGIARLQLTVVPLLSLGLFVFGLLRARENWRMLGVALAALVAVQLSMRLTLGVPRYVRWEAAPLVAALEDYQRTHGRDPTGGSPFAEEETPPELQGLVDRDCFYASNDRGLHVTCRGVLFTHCTYDLSTRRWSAWD
jgi:hypothetical protein